MCRAWSRSRAPGGSMVTNGRSFRRASGRRDAVLEHAVARELLAVGQLAADLDLVARSGEALELQDRVVVAAHLVEALLVALDLEGAAADLDRRRLELQSGVDAGV